MTDSMVERVDRAQRFSVVFESRKDGGWHVYSDDLPGLVFSHPNLRAILSDLAPALAAILPVSRDYLNSATHEASNV